MKNNNFPSLFPTPEEASLNRIIRQTKQNKLIKTASAQELNDSHLWFKGYSIYKTAWCKKYLACLIFDPSFDFSSPFNLEKEYVALSHVWHAHHWELSQRHLSYPTPPRYLQFEEATKFLQSHDLINTITLDKSLFNWKRSKFLQLFLLNP